MGGLSILQPPARQLPQPLFESCAKVCRLRPLPVNRRSIDTSDFFWLVMVSFSRKSSTTYQLKVLRKSPEGMSSACDLHWVYARADIVQGSRVLPNPALPPNLVPEVLMALTKFRAYAHRIRNPILKPRHFSSRNPRRLIICVETILTPRMKLQDWRHAPYNGRGSLPSSPLSAPPFPSPQCFVTVLEQSEPLVASLVPSSTPI